MISIAIDGPSGAGKSSLAKALAKDLGYVYVDTGAMYRSIGLYAVRAGVDPHDADAVAALLPQVKLGIRLIDGAQHIYLNGEDVSTAIRAEEIGMAASAVAAHPAVRSFLLDTQRGLAESQNILMDGRDIGTVVLPNAVDGIVTGCILAVGRIVGESAALLYTAGFGLVLNNFVTALESSSATLTVALYVYASERGETDIAFAIATILMLLTLVINLSANLVGRKLKKN